VIRRVEAVAFDLDGTLVDSREDIVGATNRTLRDYGLPELPGDEIAGYVGDGARKLMARSARLSLADRRLDAILASFVDYYTRHAADRTRLMPGAREVLRALSDLPLALCTNKPRAIAAAVLDRFELGALFACVLAGGDLPEQKPDPAVFRHLAARLAVPPGALVVVGDGPQDVLGARAAGARSIAFEGGFTSAADLARTGPDAMVGSLTELPAVVRRWQKDAQETSA
jgi:phosphoglycolate phosphatase